MSERSHHGEGLHGAIERWDGLGVVSRYDAATDAWIFIALHDNTLGPMAGGTRMKRYPSPADGLTDAMRLAAGMTRKWAAIDLGCGGGKAVLALGRDLKAQEREGLLLRYGRLVEALSGTFGTGPDLGTTMQDMLLLAKETRYIHGIDPETGAYVDSGPYTARGVLAAIHGCLEHRFGEPSSAGKRVLIEGVGGVGEPLARLLAAEGAELILADLEADRAASVAMQLRENHAAKVTLFEGSPSAVVEQPCDVYAPCAVGGTLNETTIARLACAIVAGSANNQLAEPQDADRLAARGILYAPDYIANGAGAITFGMLGRGERDGEKIAARIDAISQTLAEIFAEAADQGISTAAASDRRVERVLAQARQAKEKAV